MFLFGAWLCIVKSSSQMPRDKKNKRNPPAKASKEEVSKNDENGDGEATSGNAKVIIDSPRA